jgi:hypothetical protein
VKEDFVPHNGRMALIPFSPSALVEFGRNAAGQVIETAATIATVPVRVLSLVGQAELLATRITVAVENAEALIERVGRIAAEAEALVGAVALTAEQATRVVVEAESVATGAARVVGGAAAATDAATSVITDAAATTGAASAVVVRASTATTEAEELLHSYGPTLRKAAPMAQRFVDELSPEEISAAIKMIDELPRLREHMSDDVLPLLNKLDKVGPDLHQLLEVTQDLHLAIAGLPGLKMLRRRGEERIEEESSNGR